MALFYNFILLIFLRSIIGDYLKPLQRCVIIIAAIFRPPCSFSIFSFSLLTVLQFIHTLSKYNELYSFNICH